jgi:hypothetical protein
VTRDDAAFPLSAASFHAIDPYVGGAEPTPRYRSFNADDCSDCVGMVYWIAGLGVSGRTLGAPGARAARG